MQTKEKFILASAIILGIVAMGFHVNLNIAESKALEKASEPKYSLSQSYEEINCEAIEEMTNPVTGKKFLGCVVEISHEDENVRIFRGEGSFSENTTIYDGDSK